ncbi:MAG: penicillin-binding protein 2, partial [Gammaproteobacteria bacterium]
MRKIHLSPAGIHHLLKKRISAAVVIVVVLSLMIFSRLYYLQIYQNERYTTLSAKNQISILPISPQRGVIYDRNGIVLAENIPTFSLVIIPEKIEDIEETIEQLNAIINLSEVEITLFKQQAQHRRKSEPVPIRFKLSEADVAQLAVNQHRFPGVLVQADLMRTYPLGGAFGHVLGYIGRINEKDLEEVDAFDYQATDFIGKIGIERYYEKLLHGRTGHEEAEKDASGRVVRVLDRVAPQPGNDIYLTLDSNLQIAADEAMGELRGAVIALDPRSGEVLAMVSKPNFDPNLFVQGFSQAEYDTLLTSTYRPLFNRTIRGQYPLASTIKPFIAIQALDANIVSLDYEVYDRGWFQFPNSSRRYRDWKRDGHGWINLHRAIVASCDTFFYELANMMGIDPMYDILTAFGFGKKTGIDLMEEQVGLVPNPAWKRQYNGESWFPGDTIITGIGQGFTLSTPLQLALATAYLANKGQHVQPHLLL